LIDRCEYFPSCYGYKDNKTIDILNNENGHKANICGLPSHNGSIKIKKHNNIVYLERDIFLL
jgi:hypothetical protein